MTHGVIPMIAPDGSSGDIPQEKAADAIRAGFKPAVVMTSPDGQMGYVPHERAAEALKAGFKVGQPTTQFEKDRSGGGGAMEAIASDAGSLVKGAAKTLVTGGMGVAYQGVKQGITDAKDYIENGSTQAMRDDQARKDAGYSKTYRALAPAAEAVGMNVKGTEEAAARGDTAGVVGHAVVPIAATIAADASARVAPTVFNKVKGSVADVLEGPQSAVMPSASKLPPKAVSGAEDIFRAAAPTGKNPGFRENVMVAAPDLADVARKVNIEEAKGGIINPDMRVRATVDALDSHLDQMYKTERAPQIQAHSDVPVKVGASEDSVRGLEYLENTAGTADIRNLAEKALGKVSKDGKRMAPQPLTLAETDTLAQAANKYLKNYERAPSDMQMQMQQTSPKVGGLKALDSELGRSINEVLTSNGETGIRDYERRFAAVSEVRNQLRDRMNSVELTRQNPVKTLRSYIGSPKEAIASASQAAVADVNIGRTIQTAFRKLRESGITAQKTP